MERLRLQFSRFGEPADVLELVRRGISPPARGQIAVRMVAAPINPSDLIPVRGAYAHRIALPTVPGYEGVGVVEEAGEGVPFGMLGARVLPLRGEGTWQERVICPAEWAVPIPADLSDAAACQLYINPLTALIVCAETLELQPGGTLIANAGGSSIGRLFAGLSRLMGFRLISLVRGGGREERLIGLGASAVVDTTRADACDRLRRLTGGAGADAAIDCIGGEDGLRLLEHVRPGGRLAAIGLLSGHPVNYGRLAPSRGVGFKLFHLRHWTDRTSVANWRSCFEILIRHVRSGRLEIPEPERYYGLSDFKRAMAEAERPGRSGKIVLTFDGRNG